MKSRLLHERLSLPFFFFFYKWRVSSFCCSVSIFGSFPRGVIWDNVGGLWLRVVAARDRHWVFVVATCCIGERNTNGGRFQHFFPCSLYFLTIHHFSENEVRARLIVPDFFFNRWVRETFLCCLFSSGSRQKTRKSAALQSFARRLFGGRHCCWKSGWLGFCCCCWIRGFGVRKEIAPELNSLLMP